jgi:hypothetical protein
LEPIDRVIEKIDEHLAERMVAVMLRRMNLVKGARYRANIKLGFFEQVASNDQIKSKLEAAGFAFVIVYGSGRKRVAEGTWAQDDASVSDLPDQIDGDPQRIA